MSSWATAPVVVFEPVEAAVAVAAAAAAVAAAAAAAAAGTASFAGALVVPAWERYFHLLTIYIAAARSQADSAYFSGQY